MRQRDLTPRRVYDDAYIDHYRNMDAQVRSLSAARLRVLEAFVPRRPGMTLLDFGCGSGRFVECARRAGWVASGCDVVPGEGVLSWPEAVRLHWDVVTFFDSLEHCPDPAEVVRALHAPAVMISVPWCHYPQDRAWFMAWKHRRPGEHLWAWSREGLDAFFAARDYHPLCWSCFEDDWRARYDPALPNILSAIYTRAARERCG